MLIHNIIGAVCRKLRALRSARLVVSVEVIMAGGLRLLWMLGLVVLAGAVLWGEDGSSTTTALVAPPKAKVEVIEDNIHGHKIADRYRWMEDSNSPATEEYVREQLAYTRSILDPLPGRAQIHQRLKELLSIGTIGTPQIGGKYYFYTRREGSQNQPVLLVRDRQRSSCDSGRIEWWIADGRGVHAAS